METRAKIEMITKFVMRYKQLSSEYDKYYYLDEFDGYNDEIIKVLAGECFGDRGEEVVTEIYEYVYGTKLSLCEIVESIDTWLKVGGQ